MLALRQLTHKCSRIAYSQFLHRNYATTYYSEKHEWITVDGNKGKVGITDYAQSKLGDIVYVQLPEKGSSFQSHDECATIESVKAASEIYTPVSGTIVSVNPAVEKETSLVNKSAENEGWLFEIQLSKPEELKELLDKSGYEKFLLSEE